MVRFGTPSELADARTRSHLGDGRCAGWYGDPGVVIDAEYADREVPPALAARFGRDDFWARWTQAECAAKLADRPMVLWLREHGLAADGALLRTELTEAAGRPVVLTLARRTTVSGQMLPAVRR